ncbi:MAG: N-acetyltransferase family protein [Burkholderiales bacterium]
MSAGQWQATDGTLVTFRPIRPDDLARERAFLEGLSVDSLYQRLMTTRNLLPGELERLTNVDRDHETAIVATIVTNSIEQQIGVARYVRDKDSTAAEFAIVIADAWQGRGLGRRLLQTLIDCAERADITALGGLTFAGNRGMLALAHALGFKISMIAGDGTVRQLTRPLGGQTTT